MHAKGRTAMPKIDGLRELQIFHLDEEYEITVNKVIRHASSKPFDTGSRCQFLV